MSQIVVAGGGAFGTALAIALATREAKSRTVTLWARDGAAVRAMVVSRDAPRLPGVHIPESVAITADPQVMVTADMVLLAVPAQALRGVLSEHAGRLRSAGLVACGKGIDLATLQGPSALIAAALPGSRPAVLTGPGFAADIARGRPVALTLACADTIEGVRLQAALSTSTLRLYRTTDVVGAELGGALKNVVAIACGACMGAGYGESARAGLLARGFAEMTRLARRLGAEAETLQGLSGLGDLVLTATSEQSRNYRYGLALGRGEAVEMGATVEGPATARATLALGMRLGVEVPITAAVAGLVEGRLTVAAALRGLLDRPLREE